ncbi:unnamed protein product [Cylindrotheca closterium]|uniref:Uncharacterized protein n=1 Tax=Cylindrotheca closterium TaxID=2856 RepID=A0AAD2FGW9_9STRA|nr:unnamed protein product [Cylindrotheca closterium]
MNLSYADLRPKDQVQLNVYDDDRNDHRSSSQHVQKNSNSTSSSYSKFSPQHTNRATETDTVANNSTVNVLAAVLPQTRSAKRRNKFRTVAKVISTSKQRFQASFNARTARSASSSSSALTTNNIKNKLSLLDPKQQLQKWIKEPTELKRKRNLNIRYKSQLDEMREHNRGLLQQVRMEKMDFSHQRLELEREVLELETRLKRINDPITSSRSSHHSEALWVEDHHCESGKHHHHHQQQQQVLEPVRTMRPSIGIGTPPTSTTSNDHHLSCKHLKEDPMEPMAPILTDTFIAVKEEQKEKDAVPVTAPSSSTTISTHSLPQAIRTTQIPRKDDSKQAKQKAVPIPKATPMTPKDPMSSISSTSMVEGTRAAIHKQANNSRPEPLRVRNALSRARLAAANKNSSNNNNNNNTPSLVPPMETSPKDPLTMSSSLSLVVDPQPLEASSPSLSNNHLPPTVDNRYIIGRSGFG